jgi:hypothetical protein
MPRGWRLSLLSLIPFSLLLLPPTTARKARDRNEVSERKIKFARSRLRRIKHKIGRRFWERMPQLLFCQPRSRRHSCVVCTVTASPKPQLKGGAVLIFVLLGVRDDNAANVSGSVSDQLLSTFTRRKSFPIRCDWVSQIRRRWLRPRSDRNCILRNERPTRARLTFPNTPLRQ